MYHIAGGKENVFSADSFDQLVSGEFFDTVNSAGCKEGECFYYCNVHTCSISFLGFSKRLLPAFLGIGTLVFLIFSTKMQMAIPKKYDVSDSRKETKVQNGDAQKILHGRF